MIGIGEVFLLLGVTYYAVTRIFPQFIRWIVKRWYHIEARIGRIGLPYLSFHDVYFSAKGYAVEIDQIGFRSSFLSSEVTKMVSVNIHDMRINKDMGRSDPDSSYSDWRKAEWLNSLKIPPIVITLAQFMSVRAGSVTVAIVGNSQVFHSTLSEVTVDASVVHSARSILATATLGSLSCRLLTHQAAPPSLVHVATSVILEAAFLATTPITTQNASIKFSNLKTTINEALLLKVLSRTPSRPSKAVKKNISDYDWLYYTVCTLVPLVPRKLCVRFDDCKFADSTERDVTTLQQLAVDGNFNPFFSETEGLTGSGALKVSISGLDIKSRSDSHLSLSLLLLESNLDGRRLDVKLSVNSFLSAFDADHLDWLIQFVPDQDGNESGVSSTKRFSSFELSSSIELWNVSSSIRKLSVPEALISSTHTKFIYKSHPPDNGDKWELLTENVTLQVARSSRAPPRKEHLWGTSMFLGVLLLRTHGEAIMGVHGMLDHVRLEWSPPLASLLLSLLKLVPEKWLKSASSSSSGVSGLSIKIALSNNNLFFIAENKVCLMVRIDNATAESKKMAGTSNFHTTLQIEGTKLASITPTTVSFPCLRSQDIKNWYGSLEMIRIEHISKSGLSFKLYRQNQVVWSPNLHMKLREVSSAIVNFSREASAVCCSQSVVSTSQSTSAFKLLIVLKGHAKIVFKLASVHHLTLTTDDFSYLSSPAETTWDTSLVKIAVNSAEIFLIEKIKFITLSDDEWIRAERAASEGFTLAWNRTWSIGMQSVKAVFPYIHQFAAAIQDELITVFKWLKKLHRKEKKSSSVLPPDLFITVKEFLFETSDDPFEIRLRDNYELLVDEHKESLKRQKMLEAKVAELCKTHLLLPAGKVDELYDKLSKMNAKIYVHRSKQIQEGGARTRLLAWIVSDLQVLAMADPSMHGRDNVIAAMTQIDPQTPWPEEGLEFSTLWCRSVVVNSKEFKLQLRDFPQPWVDLKELQLWGKLVGAEQLPTRRAKRSVILEVGEPWCQEEIERSMTSLKFYHDFNLEAQHFSYAFGPCWEPVIAECNLSFEKIIRPSLDPSPPLPIWDKLRLIFHGRVTALFTQMTALLHASLDPYNTTEEMEITWSSVLIDWINAKMVFKGNLDIFVRTASKYDDCRLLHLPNLKLSVKLGWVCLGDPNDHHSVMPCAPDKLPDYSSNQEHDSFRAFRSQNLNISLALETKANSSNDSSALDLNSPVALLYGSTLRWFENLKLILSGVTRPTRRGTVFHNVRPRKLPLSRHYRKVHVLLSLHTFQVHYWMSTAMQRGFELTGESISFSSEHVLSLVPIQDGLKHRPRADWSILYMTCELQNAEIWLRSAMTPDRSEQNECAGRTRLPVEKCYFLSVGKVSYGREGVGLGQPLAPGGTPTHRLVVHGLKAAWTMSNRDVVFALFDSFMKTKLLKKNLSTEALKGIARSEGGVVGTLKAAALAGASPVPVSQGEAASGNTQTQTPLQQATPSPLSKLVTGAANMLQQLIAEADTKAVVFSEEPTSEPSQVQPLLGLAACQHSDQDVIHNNWSISLVNSQVLLKGPETRGYVIISAAKTEVLQRIHRPVWRDRTLVAKTSWIGSLQSMQYYATVSAGQSDSLDENIMWLSVDNIKEKDDCIISGLPDVPQLVGSGQSVGGVVSETVGASSASENPPLQLQRIVSRCKCEFFYVAYGESTTACPSYGGVIPPPHGEDSSALWEAHQPPVDAFTLMHHDLDVCTNSLQYAMLLDIVNNLLLYVDPSRKERYEKLQRMRFQRELQSVEDQRRPIQEAQTHVRAELSKLRSLEKEMYLVQRALGDEPGSLHLAQQMENLERQVSHVKDQVATKSEELDLMLACYKESQLMAASQERLATARNNDSVPCLVRASEICFKHAQWRLTEADGQLGIADLLLTNFLYTKNSKSDDSVEHLLEVGYVRMTNLLPNQVYKEVLQPTEIDDNMPVDRKRAVRVFCREKAKVGGISVMEHFEINVVPLTIGLTKKFFSTMLKFCFPERETDDVDSLEDGEGGSKKSKSHKGKDISNFYVTIARKDDIEKMKERAEKNKLFIYIKIPEVPVKVSYKGNKEKNIKDITDFSLVIPTLEYHNVTWTWLDLLLAMKVDSRRVILSQAIKQKLAQKLQLPWSGADDVSSPQEEDKAKLLFGSRHMPGENKELKKRLFKFPK